MFKLKANTPRWVIILMDLILSLLGLAFAYLIRFDLKADRALIESQWTLLSKSIGVFFLVKLLVYYFFNIHKGLVRYTSTEDIRRIFFAVYTCSIIYLILGLLRFYFLDKAYLFPLSVLIVESLVSFVLMLGSRFSIKLLYLESIKSKSEEERVLIYGAGISGLITKRTIEKDIRLTYKIVGFIDDNKKMSGTRLEGITIFSTSDLVKIIKEEGVNTVIIAIQQPDEENRKRVVEICLENQVKVQKVPSPKSWINGEFSAKQIAKVRIEDLLGRKPIVLDEKKI
jgi:FlaA1/EpsC-like NDP-sugar epimerase